MQIFGLKRDIGVPVIVADKLSELLYLFGDDFDETAFPLIWLQTLYQVLRYLPWTLCSSFKVTHGIAWTIFFGHFFTVKNHSFYLIFQSQQSTESSLTAPDGKLYGRTWRPGFEVQSVFGGQRKPHTEIAVQEDTAEREQRSCAPAM